MKKRLFADIKRAEVTEKMRDMAALSAKTDYIVSAGRTAVYGRDTLVLNYFRVGDGDIFLQFRTFCQYDGYITQDMGHCGVKWRTSSAARLVKGSVGMAGTEDMDAVVRFMRDCKEHHAGTPFGKKKMADGRLTAEDIRWLIEDYQECIMNERLEALHQKRREAIDAEMEKFGGVPDDFGDFVKHRVFDGANYMFYSRKGKKAYCSRCETDFALDGHGHIIRPENGDLAEMVGHNREIVCPKCGRQIVCKSEGMGRKNLFKVQWSTLVQSYGGEVLTRSFCHTKDLTDYRSPVYRTAEMCRSVHTEKGAKDYEYCYSQATGRFGWNRFRNGIGCGIIPPSRHVRPYSTVVYESNLREALANTYMKYSAMDGYIGRCSERNRDGSFKDGWVCDRYCNAYRGCPGLEKLVKAGLFRIAGEAVAGRYGRIDMRDGRTAAETLGISRRQYKMLAALGNPSGIAVEILKNAPETAEKDFAILYEMEMEYGRGTCGRVLPMTEYATLRRIRRYLSEQGIKYIRDYDDHLKLLKELGYDMKNTFNLFPRDFPKAHERLAEEHRRKQDAVRAEKRKRYETLVREMEKETSGSGPLHLSSNGLFIRLPRRIDELKAEGEALRHCVGSYADRVAEGKTMIFFIRKETEPDKSYYTLEWNGEIVQCRGYRNCGMTPEVEAFAAVFDKKMRDYAGKELPLRRAS